MNAAGIDVSKNKSMVAVLRPFGEIVMLPFEVKHSIAGLKELAKQLKAIDGETRVVMEHMLAFLMHCDVCVIVQETFIVLL